MAKSSGRGGAATKHKQSKKYAQKGHLAREIKERRKRQLVKGKIEGRQRLRQHAAGAGQARDGAAAEDDDDDDAPLPKFVERPAKDSDDEGEDMNEEETLRALLEDDEDEQEGGSDGDDASDSLADLEGEEEKHMLDIAALKEKDPEFYKYLQENDKALLEFGNDKDDDDDAPVEDEDDEQPSKLKGKGKGKARSTIKEVVVTKDLLKSWQKQMLQTRSLKTLRKVLLCFRTAASSQSTSDDADERVQQQTASQSEIYSIQNATVFNSIVVSALKYTPLVLGYHVPARELPNGKYRVSTQSKKYATAQRIIKSYFSSLHTLLPGLSAESGLLQMCIQDSSRLIPYLVGNRKASKTHLRVLLEMWAGSGDDAIRLAAFLSIRKLALAGDKSLQELVLKGTYLAIQQVARNTNAYTLPSINLMKNSASTLFLLSPENDKSGATHQPYQIAFRYIRQLAITLRNSMKLHNTGGQQQQQQQQGGGQKKGKKDAKDRHRDVYNWTFYHSIDFWSLVLSTACDSANESEAGRESELRPLIYPLVQITLGVIRLVPTSRYYPLRFQLVTSLIRIMQRTATYIPLAPFLLEILDSSEFSRKPKGSSLKPLDWSYYLRSPAAYSKTRVYVDGITEEVAYLILEVMATQSSSIAFPELIIPLTVALRRYIKKHSKNGKLVATLKALVERMENNSKWIQEKRSKVDFSPQDREQVDSFLQDESEQDKSPLRIYLKLQRKVREQKRALLEKSLADDDGDDLDAMEEDEDEEDDQE